MLKVDKRVVGNRLLIRLSGSLEESLDFDSLIGQTVPEMEIYCKDVLRINSVGVRVWIKYFQRAADTGTVLRFYECSPAIVAQINNISNFACGGKIISISLPFICSDCGAELVSVSQCDKLVASKFNIEPPPCTKCGGLAIFDDVPEEYFSFLKD